MLGIVTAFKQEIKGYLKSYEFRVVDRDNSLRFHRSTRQPNVVVAEGAVGRERAEASTRQLIERYKPDGILSAGFAGAVRAGLKPGDLFLCDRLMSIEDPPAWWRADEARERPLGNGGPPNDLTSAIRGALDRYALCGCLSVPTFISSSSTKAWIGETFPVSIIDMESYWVSETATAYGIPHAVVRAVFDPLDQTLPPFVGRVTGDERGPRLQAAMRYIFTKPGHTPTLIHLSMQAKAASASLTKFLVNLGSTGLCSPATSMT